MGDSPLHALEFGFTRTNKKDSYGLSIPRRYTPKAGGAHQNREPHRGRLKSDRKLGGKVIGGWFSYGEYDVVLVTELPDNVSAAAFAVAAAAGGGLKANKTTPLLNADETLQMLSRAGKTGYRPPE